jgi:hypothetical protein
MQKNWPAQERAMPADVAKVRRLPTNLRLKLAIFTNPTGRHRM